MFMLHRFQPTVSWIYLAVAFSGDAERVSTCVCALRRGVFFTALSINASE